MAYQEDLHPLLGKAVEHINRVMVGKRDIAILSLSPSCQRACVA